jgi:hypothetical protein
VTPDDSVIRIDTARPARVARRLRAVTGVVAVVASAWQLRTIFDRGWSNPEPSLSASHSDVAGRVLDQLHDDGIRFTSSQRDAMRRLIGLWERRGDIRQLFVTGTGDPDLPALIRWANQNQDPDTLQLVVIRPALSEAAARMGLLDADGDIIPVLVQTIAMREQPKERVGGALWILAEVWNRRADVRTSFSEDGVVNVRALFGWAATLPVTDRDYETLRPAINAFDKVLDELPRAQRRAA